MQTFTIKIKSSLSKQLLIVLPHVIITVLLLSVLSFKDLTKLYLLISLSCIALSLIYFVRLHLTFSTNKSINIVRRDASDNWTLISRNDEIINVLMSATSFNSNLLIILNFEDVAKQQYTALVTPDSVTENEFRRLKVFLKTKKFDV